VFDSLCIGVCERQCLNNHIDFDVDKSLLKYHVGDPTYSSLCSWYLFRIPPWQNTFFPKT